MSSVRSLIAAYSLVLCAASASAQITQGMYISGAAGISDIGLTEGAVGGQSFKQNWQSGGVGVLALGYGFGNGLRAEIGGSYRAY